MKQKLFNYIKTKYNVAPEYPWRNYAGNAVFRHAGSEINWDFPVWTM